jgi:cell division inhibitor SulA
MKTLPESLDALLQGRRIWRGASTGVPSQPGCGTGLRALDAVLPSGGWPASGLVEVLHGAPGQGELSLILPSLAHLTRRARPVLLIAPPYQPYAPAWQQAGVHLARLHVLRVEASSGLWAMEQALRAGCCGAVLGWLPIVDDKALRRLQLAAETGPSLGFLFRGLAAGQTNSLAALRIAVEAGRGGNEIRVLKCRGRNPPQAALSLRSRSLH